MMVVRKLPFFKKVMKAILKRFSEMAFQSQFFLADRVLGIIFAFLKAYFLVLGRLYAPCATIGQQLPSTVYVARKVCHRASFPVCKRCSTVWTYQDCIEECGRNQRAKVCSYIDPLGRRRSECSGVLLKTGIGKWKEGVLPSNDILLY